MTTNRSQFLANANRLVEAAGDQVPAWSPEVQTAADHALVGEIFLSPDGSYTKLDFDHIDWTCEKTSNRESVQMYLLRFHVLMPLASAFRQTKDERYAQAARKYIEAFLRDHPTREGWAPADYDGATQYDLRVGCGECPGWLGVLHVLLHSKAFDDAFFDAIIAAARAHLLYLSGHVFPHFNIRATHGDVLLTNGLLLSFLPEAKGWLDQGRRILNDAARRQILPDGVHLEAVPLYHGVVMGLLTHIWKLAQAMPELGLIVPTERIAAMHDYAASATRPDGALSSIGDTRYSAPKGRFDHNYIDSRAAFRKAAKLPAQMPPACHHFPDANQVFLRDSWTPEATYITFDATTRRSFHWHPGANSIQLFAGGRALLVDTGYPFKTAEFPFYGKLTSQHNTISLNGWDQADSVCQLRLRQAPGYDLVEGYYDGGYWPLKNWSHGTGLYGQHHRTMLWVRGRFIVVLDHIRTSAEDNRKPSLESVWQLSEGKVVLDAKARRVATAHDDSNLLMLFPLAPENSTLTVHEGERDPMRGWVPIEWGKRCIPAPMVRLATPKSEPWNTHLVTVLVPFTGQRQPQVEARAASPDIGLGGPHSGELELRWEDGSRDQLLWTPRLETAIGENHGVDSDASLTHAHFDRAGELLGGLVVEGNYFARGGAAQSPAAIPGQLTRI